MWCLDKFVKGFWISGGLYLFYKYVVSRYLDTDFIADMEALN